MSRVVYFVKSLDTWVECFPHEVHIGQICQQIRGSCKKPNWDSDFAQIKRRRIWLSIMRLILPAWSVVISLELSAIKNLFPMRHVHDACSWRIMSNQNIVPFIVVQRRIPIHDLSHHISTDFRKSWTKGDPCCWCKPIQAWHELINSSQMIPLKQQAFVQQVNQMRPCIFDIRHWTKSKVLVQISFNDWILLGQGDKHLNRSLTVADVMHLLASVVVHVLESGWQIKVGHVLESEFPKLFVLVGIVFDMRSWVLVTATVAKPNIIPAIGKHQAWSSKFVVNYPAIWWIK